MKLMQRLPRVLSLHHWPLVTCLLLVLVAGALQWTSFALKQKSLALEQQSAAAPTAGASQGLPDMEADLVASLPDQGSYTRDLASFFKIANDSAMELGAIDYRVEENPKLPYLINRSMEFRLNDEYPKVKAFLSRVLQKLPHVSLQEIRIEKKDVLTAQGAVQVRLVLLYRVMPTNSGGANGK